MHYYLVNTILVQLHVLRQKIEIQKVVENVLKLIRRFSVGSVN
jgi:hypothetical protein